MVRQPSLFMSQWKALEGPAVTDSYAMFFRWRPTSACHQYAQIFCRYFFYLSKILPHPVYFSDSWYPRLTCVFTIYSNWAKIYSTKTCVTLFTGYHKHASWRVDFFSKTLFYGLADLGQSRFLVYLPYLILMGISVITTPRGVPKIALDVKTITL